MKAIEIARKNHISFDDMIQVCRELEIRCESEDTDLADKDIFLVEKKIEAIKKRRAQQIEASKKGKKIKLKRKVHVPKESSEAPAEPQPQAPPKPHKPEARRPAHELSRSKPMPSRPPKAARPVKEVPKPVETRPKEGIVPEKPVETKERPKKKAKEKDKEREKKKYRKEQEEKEFLLRKKAAEDRKAAIVTPAEIHITESISVGDLAKKLNIKAADVIAKLMKLGVMATINQVIDAETAEILASEYGSSVKVVSMYDETIIKQAEDDKPEDYRPRPPVVTVMGHVDHGKTKLLDAIRQTNVIDHEHGGITQHIGAYTATINERSITFLDTPGHEAFTAMRARGAKVTDIVVLVVAANDGVMPQTVEAINHAKDAGVPIIVAINKIDLPEANPEKVMHELAKYGLVPEKWGGNTLYAEISAKFNKNIESLLELILIQAEMLELKANPSLRAKGTVLEAKLDPGRGAVATVLIQNGTLRIGDPFVIGVFSGKVRAMFDDRGRAIAEAGPSIPVEVLGISGVPSAGDPFEGVDSEKTARARSFRNRPLQRDRRPRERLKFRAPPPVSTAPLQQSLFRDHRTSPVPCRKTRLSRRDRRSEACRSG